MTAAVDYLAQPDASGHFGRHGGRFVAETLVEPLRELAAAYDAAREDPAFQAALDDDLAHYVGRPSPIYFAERLSREAGGARILLKREDLNHTGAHKVNNTVGQALLAGGLKPGNVFDAITTALPWGVDVSSGVESEPGIKDGERLRRFVEEVRRADCHVEHEDD